jgi:hypothetical protein
MLVINRSKRAWIVSKVRKADSYLSRTIGWIGGWIGRSNVSRDRSVWCFQPIRQTIQLRRVRPMGGEVIEVS